MSFCFNANQILEFFHLLVSGAHFFCSMIGQEYMYVDFNLQNSNSNGSVNPGLNKLIWVEVIKLDNSLTRMIINS